MASNSREFPVEAKSIITTLRALVVSGKQPIAIRELQNTYLQLEGTRVNYQKYGFHKLEDFLLASGEFNISMIQNEAFIAARANMASEHLRKMIARQKSARPKRKKSRSSIRGQPPKLQRCQCPNSFANHSPYPPMQKPKYNQNILNMNSYRTNTMNQNINMSNTRTNSTPLPHLPLIDRNPPMANRMDKLTQNVNNSRENFYPLPHLPLVERKPQIPDLREKLNQKRNLNTQQDLNPLPLVNRKPPIVDSEEESIQKNFFISIIRKQLITNVSQKSANVSPREKLSDKLLKKDVTTQTITSEEKQNKTVVGTLLRDNSDARRNSTQIKVVDQNLDHAFRPPIKKPSIIVEKRSTHKTAIQERLKVEPPALNFEIKQSPSIISNDKDLVAKNEETKENCTTKPLFQFNPSLTPGISLVQYCEALKCPQPKYKTLKLNNSKRYQCRVLVNRVIYSTYPNDYATEAEAEVACAKMAMEQLNAETNRLRYPMCMESDFKIALKLFEELKNYPHGIFSKNIPDVFGETFQQSLPDHWFSILQTCPHLFAIEKDLCENIIVYANRKSPGSSSLSTVSDEETNLMSRLELPWEKEQWNLFITNPTSTSEIWARIVDPEYSGKWEALLNDIKVHMATKKSEAKSVTTGQIYLVCVSDSWQRVLLYDKDDETGKCYCFFIDSGDEKCYNKNQLYVCESKFLKLSPQAVLFSLFGLEDFTENSCARPHLIEMLGNKTLTAEILTHEKDFEPNAIDLYEFNSKIQIVLYDKNAEKNNLNSLMLQKICNDIPPPALKREGISNVFIAHFAENGDLFLHTRNFGLGFVQKFIQELIESKFKKDQHRVKYSDLRNSKDLFLVHDIEENRWVRGSIVKPEVDSSCTECKILYVDYGKIKTIAISNLYRLRSLSWTLYKFPRQTIKVRLYDLPPMNESIMARLRGLLTVNSEALVKLVSAFPIPQVTVYRRLHKNQALVNINESIRLEYEIEWKERGFLQMSRRQNAVSVSNGSSSESLSDTTECSRNISTKLP